MEKFSPLSTAVFTLALAGCIENRVGKDLDSDALLPDLRMNIQDAVADAVVPDSALSDAVFAPDIMFALDAGVSDTAVADVLTADAALPDATIEPDASVPPRTYTRGQAFDLLESCVYPRLAGDAEMWGLPECVVTDEAGGNAVQRDAAERLCIAGHVFAYPDESFGLDRTISSAEFAQITTHVFDIPLAEVEGDMNWYDPAYRALLERNLVPADESMNARELPSVAFIDAIEAHCAQISPCFGKDEFQREQLFDWLDQLVNPQDGDCTPGTCCAVSERQSTAQGNRLGEMLCEEGVVALPGDGSYHADLLVSSGELACGIAAAFDLYEPFFPGLPNDGARCIQLLGDQGTPLDLSLETHADCPPSHEFVDSFLSTYEISR